MTELPAETDPAEIDRIVTAAVAAAAELARTTPAERAAWLHAAADALDAAAGELIELAAAETHLPAQPRLRGELVRTVFQLRLFAEVLTDGEFLRATVDHADPAWPMGPRPDIRRTVVPIGPVLVFAASNFPLTLSVAGHDTAAALAAGCPVVLKAHPGHPRLSARVRDLLVAALTGAGAPAGTFENIYGVEAGAVALRHPGVEAASFTGSEAGGRALFDIANARPRPIPFYGELGSVNPVVVTPGAVAARGPEIATGYVGSFTLGAGQFCTKPGLLLLPAGHGLDEALTAAVKAVPAQQMLNDRIAAGFRSGVTRLDDHPAVTVLAATEWGADAYLPTLLKVAAADFAPDTLGRECFGPASIVIEYRDIGELRSVLEELDPGLTATVHAERDEADTVHALLPTLTRLAGRLIWNGWPTGITLSWAQQHGGPYPATTAPTFTSMGTAAIDRFLRPVAWQDFPDEFLPPALQEANPWQLPRRIDGKR
ncbi:aldehyde dehydrogenase (NADP(+)) [Nocardia aurantia]|uniref:Alpha-ketoglutaric semialdehyde dehydrogenase n=1 Tax=Nocardia aurantia TaxID=2585199 RepID=A0A7K0DVH7_9NOCA|nr:aldehyde dehydrogenase (NADP(+)) [Nocardia aurantia]MQY29786.1 Alpha-ketoglutaric semialdehyde dehydrogenase [Nocardia aurantia]